MDEKKWLRSGKLAAYEAANAEHSLAGKRWAIEHLFVSRPDQLERIKKLDLYQPALRLTLCRARIPSGIVL